MSIALALGAQRRRATCKRCIRAASATKPLNNDPKFYSVTSRMADGAVGATEGDDGEPRRPSGAGSGLVEAKSLRADGAHAAAQEGALVAGEPQGQLMQLYEDLCQVRGEGRGKEACPPGKDSARGALLGFGGADAMARLGRAE